MSFSEELLTLKERVLDELAPSFRRIEQMSEENTLKVLTAMRECKVSDIHFNTSSGYAYDDIGRSKLEELYAKVFAAESALVRTQFVSGTHALATVLFGILRPGDKLVSLTGTPYDTMQTVIGYTASSSGSLKEYGILYDELPLTEGRVDVERIADVLDERTKMVLIQRSRGYSRRPTLLIEDIREICNQVHRLKPDCICFVDNCYGEFVERREPSEFGADLLVGSLIKNPGGGLAPIGGYIAGKRELIENAAYRLTAPGLGKELGASLGVTRQFFQGLFLAPTVTASAEKGAIFAAQLYQNLGFPVNPRAEELRHDIIQSVNLKSPEALSAFCIGIQAASPVDSFVKPEAWDMPGYEEPVIMAAGTFVSGASIELSADGPMRPPYTAYFQGGLTYAHAKIGVLMSLQKLADAGLV